MVIISYLTTEEQIITPANNINNIIEYRNGEIVERHNNKKNINVNNEINRENKNTNVKENDDTNNDINNSNEKCKQIFKKEVPINILYKILEVVAEKHEQYYFITKVCYKKADYNNKIKELLVELKDYYFQSKVYFVERKLDYIKFIRIIKQLCNYHNIKCSNKFVYGSSQYEIDYFIHLKPI